MRRRLVTIVVFLLVGAVVVVAGIVTVTRRNPIHAALSMLVALSGVAGLFLGLRSGGNPGALGAFLLLVVLAYLPAYLWTRRDLTWHLETTLTRIAAPLGALLLLLVGGQLAAWLHEPRPSSSVSPVR